MIITVDGLSLEPHCHRDATDGRITRALKIDISILLINKPLETSPLPFQYEFILSWNKNEAIVNAMSAKQVKKRQ